MYLFACKIIGSEANCSDAKILEEVHKIVYRYGKVIPKETIYIVTLNTENRIIYEDTFEKYEKH